MRLLLATPLTVDNFPGPQKNEPSGNENRGRADQNTSDLIPQLPRILSMNAFEGSVKRRQVLEAGLKSDRGNLAVRLRQQVFGMLDS